ncbi:hypothetical protein TTHERM_00618840 (macronuclear) [Tetrahymena thermophila SB210]|uniref:Uncharacterized protein n=1 Tax=Tetrahymena thermophila (strain SB210) TaxID=312017 RepID=Q23MH7_TETTS|nr:hypothetical protein TTHERM_00618840 [Tetrahymena thermophila SB210]EAR97662.3 hypothetical protein TTHERM_00618840 [Tetrahymena thermophila SB210]|eukprot:XP_001017907.3 hypothetical protein TTHERM_00618840 [Tetrahymena thermophila SB210]
MNFFHNKIKFILKNHFSLKKGQFLKNSFFNHSISQFRFCSSQSSQSKIEDILKQINNYDSIQIIEEYRNYAQTTSNFTKFMEISNQFLKQMKSREEQQKALEICDIVVQSCLTKFTQNNENPQIFFKGQQALLNYKLKKNEESSKIAESLYKDFSSQLNKLKTFYLILSAKYLLEVMAQIKNIEISKKLLNDIQILLAEDNWQTLSSQQIFDLYYIHFGIYYLDQNFQEAAEWGWKSYQQLVKLNNSNFRPEYILIGVYICYNRLNQKDKCEEALVEIQKYNKFSREYLDQLEQSYIQPFEVEKQEEREKKFQQIQQQNKNDNKNKTENNSESKQETNSQNQAKTNLKDEDKGNYFIQNKLFKEGIAYYKNQLQKLDAQKDILKYVFIQDRIAYLYSECQDFQKAINLCLDSHQMLLKLYDKQFVSNYETFQNLSYIKTIYEKNNELEKAIQWGQKWHDYCTKYQLFDKQSEVIESNMLSHAVVLSKAGQASQALLYCQNIIKYLQKFPNNKEILKFGLNQLLYSLSQQAHNTQGQKEAAISLCELSRNIMIQDKEYRSYYFMMLKESINLSLIVDDKKNFMKYGSEYLKVRDQYEEEDLESAVQIMFDISQQLVQDNEYNQAVEVLQKALSISKRAPIDQNQIQMNLLLTTLYILQNKIEDAEQYLQQATYLYDTYFASLSNQQNLEIDIVKIQAIIQYHKQNNGKCLDLIEKYFQILSTQQSNEIYEDIIIILSNLSSNKEHQHRVNLIQVKYNLNLD